MMGVEQGQEDSACETAEEKIKGSLGIKVVCHFGADDYTLTLGN